MAMVVRTNAMGINANRQLTKNNNQVSKGLEKLSSGFRINRAGDDASGLAISEKMKAQIRGLETAAVNAQDGISLIQTAEGALDEVHSMLNRMVELCGKAANGTMDDSVDRVALQQEVDALIDEIDRISDSTNFNGIQLLDGSLGGAKVSVKNSADSYIDANDTVVAATVAKTTLDFDGRIGDDLIGGTMTIGNTTYAFIETGDTSGIATASAAGYTVIQLNKADTAETIATKVAGKVAVKEIDATTGTAGSTAATVAASGKTVTITGATADADASLPEVEFANVGLTLQIGDTAADFNKMRVSVGNMSAEGLGIKEINVETQTSASEALAMLRGKLAEGGVGAGAINTVSSTRAALGALQNRLEHTINNLEVATENITTANSRIRDTDMAKQMMNYTQMNVLTQSAMAMLAQANQQPQSVLQLLQ